MSLSVLNLSSHLDGSLSIIIQVKEQTVQQYSTY